MQRQETKSATAVLKEEPKRVCELCRTPSNKLTLTRWSVGPCNYTKNICNRCHGKLSINVNPEPNTGPSPYDCYPVRGLLELEGPKGVDEI